MFKYIQYKRFLKSVFDFYCLREQNISWMFSIIINGKYLNSLKFYKINDCIVLGVLYQKMKNYFNNQWNVWN